MNTTETVLQVNELARKSRHMRIFSRKGLGMMYLTGILRFLATPFLIVNKSAFFTQIRRFFVSIKLFVLEIVPVAPQKRLIAQAVFISGVALVASSLTSGGVFTAASMTYSNEYISEYSLPGDILVSDEDGYLVKINPQTGDSNRAGMTDYAIHTVESGESLSLIAEKYDVSVETIMWENGIGNANSIRSGQKILIPPVSGLSYTVSSGDTLAKISDKYDVSVESIIAQNGLESESIAKGQDLFLPGAEPIITVSVASSDYRAPSVSRAVDYSSVSASSSAPSVGRIFIFPTVGAITNGYHSGHYAIDIADRSKPPIWAAGSGTVIKAS
ncbi:MAG: LysM peptidoglycan-binding domain-containing protein, partial [Candidatus Gracilibacteria bacterium]